jgi:hypothetical protein
MQGFARLVLLIAWVTLTGYNYHLCPISHVYEKGIPGRIAVFEWFFTIASPATGF